MTLSDGYVYQLNLVWTKERSGTLAGEDLPVVEFSAPPEFNGEAGKWTPEHFLVAAAASCFMTTFLAIAEISKLRVLSFRSQAHGKLEKTPEEGYRFTEINLAPVIEVAPEDVERALRILAKAEKNCFVTKSLRAAVRVEPEFAHALAEVT